MFRGRSTRSADARRFVRRLLLVSGSHSLLVVVALFDLHWWKIRKRASKLMEFLCNFSSRSELVFGFTCSSLVKTPSSFFHLSWVIERIDEREVVNQVLVFHMHGSCVLSSRGQEQLCPCWPQCRRSLHHLRHGQ